MSMLAQVCSFASMASFPKQALQVQTIIRGLWAAATGSIHPAG
jgi:hypothetical protein